MPSRPPPVAIHAADVPLRTAVSFYPEPFAARMAGRQKRQLGEFFALKSFGINLTRLAPGAFSSLRHAHAKQDEFIYIVSGHPTLHTDRGRMQLSPGMCAGFRAGTGDGHHLQNETAEEVFYLEIGDRAPGEEVTYPDDDLLVVQGAGKARYVHKDGSPY
jgi:uncharacterized cupin superfamily protein